MIDITLFHEVVNVQYAMVSKCESYYCYGIQLYSGKKLKTHENARLVLPYARFGTPTTYLHFRVNAIELRHNTNYMHVAVSYYLKLKYMNISFGLHKKWANKVEIGVDFRGITIYNKKYYEPLKVYIKISF